MLEDSAGYWLGVRSHTILLLSGSRVWWDMAPETATNTSNPWFNRLETSSAYAHIPLRLALAAVFGFHGIDKLANGVPAFAEMMGLPILVGWLVALGEVGIAIGAIVGGFSHLQNSDTITRVSGALTMVLMAGAVAMMHWENGWHFMQNGMEFQVTLFLLGLYFVLRGNRN